MKPTPILLIKILILSENYLNILGKWRKNFLTKDLFEVLNKKEVLGYKVMGAGGGGFVLAFFKEGKRDRFISKYLKNKLFVKPEIDDSGTKTIIY